MKTSIEKELKSYVIDLINDGVLTNENKEDWHFHAFNEDYYIIGYYQASQWLKTHDLGEFEAAAICTQYELDNFGELGKVYDNSETTVNMLAYIFGEELFSNANADTIEELEAYCEH